MGRAEILSRFPMHSNAFVGRAIGRLQSQSRIATLIGKGGGRKALYAAIQPIAIRNFRDKHPPPQPDHLHRAMLSMVAEKNRLGGAQQD